MKKVLVLFSLSIFWQPAYADSRLVSAAAVMVEIPVPTFDDVHLAYFRIVVNESGLGCLADQDGILQAMLYQGGGRKYSRNVRGTGYGLDYVKLMRRMAAHSTRAFPSDSVFLPISVERRVALEMSQTDHNRWTSTLTLDCSEPLGWSSDTPGTWRANYFKRCSETVETTRAFLVGKLASKCGGTPTTWGSESDTVRRGGPLDLGWNEIVCDRDPSVDCRSFEVQERLNSRVCARNRFWSWI